MSELTYGVSQVPGNPSFRNAAVNAVAVVPLLSSDKNGEHSSFSTQSFANLTSALQRHPAASGDQGGLLLVVPNNSLTRPGDWRYNATPLKGFHWQHGCQRLQVFDGRPSHTRLASDRLMNHTTRDWIDLCPSRRTAAVVGVLNLRDCQGMEDFQRAEEELHQWATRYAVPPYEATAHGRSLERDKPVERLFVFDSFHEDCQSLDISKSSMGNSILAFPPADEEHAEMMDLHLNVVVNDLAVAIFRNLETKIQESDAIAQRAMPLPDTSNTAGAARRSLTRIISGASETGEEPVSASGRLSVSSLANFVSPDSKLAKDSPRSAAGPSTTVSDNDSSPGSRTSFNSSSSPKLLTPLDSFWENKALSSRDVDAIKKRDVARREKWAADLSLLAGSPLDAYERYLKAAEMCKTGTPDPLWYASALEGCAAAHIAMAEAGGYGVDEYLENSFQMPDEIMALAKDKPVTTNSTKQTLPEVVFTLCEEALNITNRHEKLGSFHAELLMKLAWYICDAAEGHLRCRWGEGPGCYRGEADSIPRWEKPSVAKLTLTGVKSKDEINTFNRSRQVCELLHEAVSVACVDASTRVDLAIRAARMCLDGIKATQWKKPKQERVKLARKAALFATVAAEALTTADSRGSEQSCRDLWLLATQLYTTESNSAGEAGDYGWAALRAITLNALSVQGNTAVSSQAAEDLLSLLSEASTCQRKSKPSPAKATTPKAKKAESTETPEVKPVSQTSTHSAKSSSTDRAINTSADSEFDAAGTASTFARALRDSFTTITATSSILALESKWADDEIVKPIDVPLAQSSVAFASVQTMGCVWKNIDLDRSFTAQTRCINRIAKLRRSLCTVSTAKSLETDFDASSLPFYISSATTLKAEASMELERVKLARKSADEAENAMSTFFNPFENKRSAKTLATVVPEEEERAMAITFENRLSVPLLIQRCQLEFDINLKGKVKATPLSFTLPASVSKFEVHFPFCVLSTPSQSVRSMEGTPFEVKGLSLTMLGRAVLIPIRQHKRLISRNIPKPACVYPHLVEKAKDTESDDEPPRFETCPSQPRLLLHFAKSGAPVDPDKPIQVGLADGELFTLPSLRLKNYPGPSGNGKLLRLQIFAVGLPGLSDKKIFDSDDDDSNTDGQSKSDGWLKGEQSPLRLRALTSSLSLEEINENDGAGSAVTFQIAASQSMQKVVQKGTIIKVRFRYCGLAGPLAEFWRKREVSFRISTINGPRISSIDFRPDLMEESAYADMCKCLPEHQEDQHHAKETSPEQEGDDRSATALRVGMDGGVHVASEEVIFVLTIANETTSEVTLSRGEGPAGGFLSSPLSSLEVRSGVSAKFPIVLKRIPRVTEDGSPIDLVCEVINRTQLTWETRRQDDPLGTEMARGRLRIPRASLSDILERHPSFASRICEPPCKIDLAVAGNPASSKATTLQLGKATELSAAIQLAAWVPASEAEKCSLWIEFFCARHGARDLPSGQAPRDYVWCGKLREKFRMNDQAMAHKIKIAFVNTGDYIVSVSARIAHDGASTSMKETWWAPIAGRITVEKAEVAQ